MSICALPKISVVVPAFNTESTLRLCLDSLAKLDYPSENLEVILVDNGSTDATLDIARDYNVTILSEPTIKSSYAARNKGILAAQGELIAFTDADCIVTPGWLKNLVKYWEDQTAGCFAGEIEAYQPTSLVEKFSDRAGILRQGGTLSCSYLPYTQTANSAYRREVFEKVGLFVPEMTSGGDADIAWRMQKQLGLQVKFIPEALVYHKHRTSMEGLYTQFMKYEQGKLYWAKLYPDYQLPSFEQRQKELIDGVEECCRALKRSQVPLLLEEMDLADFCSPYLQLLLRAGTFRARVQADAPADWAIKLQAELDRPSREVLALQQELEATAYQLKEKECQLAEKEHQFAEKEHQLAETERQLAETEYQLAAMLESLSWRATMPIRKLLGKLRGHKAPSSLYYLKEHGIDPSRPTLLFIAPRLPEYDRASGDLRLFRILQILVTDYNIVYFNNGIWERFVPQGELKYLQALLDLGIDCIDSESGLRMLLKSREIGAVICEFYTLGLKYIPLLRRMCPTVPFVIDSVDVHFIRERMMSETLQDESLRSQAENTRRSEVSAYQKADNVWVVSSLDRHVLLAEGIAAESITIVPNIHTVAEDVVPRQQREEYSLLFVGGFVHQPNVDAVEFFCREIMPLVRRRVPGIHLYVVGDSPPEHIRKMAAPDVSILGFVPKTTPFLDKCMVSVAPLRYGAGLKGKVGEALAAGLPLVTTSVGAQGMDLVSGKVAFVTDAPGDFAAAVVRLLEEPDLWEACSINGLRFMEMNFGYEAVAGSLRSHLQTLISGRTQHP